MMFLLYTRTSSFSALKRCVYDVPFYHSHYIMRLSLTRLVFEDAAGRTTGGRTSSGCQGGTCRACRARQAPRWHR